MWTKAELEDLAETCRGIKLEDVLDKDEIEVIKENSTRYLNLKDGIFVPSHTRKVIFLINLIFKLILDKNYPAETNRRWFVYGFMVGRNRQSFKMVTNDYLDWVQFHDEVSKK